MAKDKDAEHSADCCVCGAPVDTREVEDGGNPEGAELSDGRWVCSPECWDKIFSKVLPEAWGSASLTRSFSK